NARGEPFDMVVGLLMVAGAALLWFAPAFDDRQTFGVEFTGSDAATAAVTVASVSAVARAVSLVIPGAVLVTIALLVLGVAVGARALPYAWRRGPVAGGAIVGAGAGAYAGVLAIIGGVGVIQAANPIWHAPLGQAWLTHATQYVSFGWQ